MPADFTFTIMQFVAVCAVSASVFLFVVALFRPTAGNPCSAYSLGIAAGMLMAGYALVQALAFVVVVVIEKTETDLGGERLA